ncbi:MULTISPECIES: XkdX family protein [Aneurinibacillus]|uniref:XkdX family protein n=1 Tax=Aneurinibacillus thermoaerophilus TaxID=143495 RepID=A0ABX8YD51_ANETH|nr:MULTISPECIES: XkdX family protein [Aneurinibacillus]AMA74009.1 hypothetical protein ACH33_14960 [Aneurinibacillus sp. XH2]MED0738886.1 XkdX family protein [Aneurinibacillus thermoaerophilus]MED0766012.1 XkdX family protein [Aneurinibacillus thermoaerophilus]QYY43406.1 XkdX family protein [Aneurinibacillus thermoaerophilus]
MNWFDTIKRYYNIGCYTDDPKSTMYVGKFVEYGKITKEEYETITGDPYLKPEDNIKTKK